MKKTLKSIIAALLATLTMFSGVTAFAAANTENQLEWDFYGETYHYDYAGELKEGENEIVYDGSDYIYYTFDVQNTGYYSMTYDYRDADFYIEIPQKVENSIAYNTISSMNYGENHISGSLFYLEKGEQIIGLDIYYVSDATKLTVDYLGEEITSIDTTKEDLILGSDIYCYNDEIEGYLYEIASDINITFSSGKSITKYYFDGSIENKIKKGENIITIWICDKKYNLNVNVELVTDYIESVEISNIEDYLYFKSYYNSFDYPEPFGETLTVTFKDGTTEEVSIGIDDNFTLPNGSEVWFGFGFTFENDKPFFDVYIADTIVKSYECTEIQADFNENKDKLNSNIISLINDASYYIRRAMIIVLECDTIYEYMAYGAEESLLRLRWACESFIGVFQEMFYLIRYYIA